MSDDPAGTLREAHAAYRIDAQTSKPTWLGHGLDVGYAIDVLHPLADPLRQRSDGAR